MKKIHKILKYVLYILATCILITIIVIAAARIWQAKEIEITSENGIQESQYVEIGGITQYLQIRGQNKENPIILVLHGGPGSPMSYYSYQWQIELENDYTIVHWDQRGSGRTYYVNEDATELATVELLLSDIDEIVAYLTTNFNQNKVIIMGHSWGTILGIQYMQQHPEKVESFVGVGQVVNSKLAEYISARHASYLAKEANDDNKANEILASYDDFIEGNLDMTKLMSLRSLTSKYLPSGDNMSGIEQIWMGIRSPQLGLDDLKWFLYPVLDFNDFIEVNMTLFKRLFFEGFNIYDYSRDYNVPMYFISGDSDWITPYNMVKDYYEVVRAPRKEMIFVKNAGHSPFLDNPTEFCEAVKQVLQINKD